MMQNNAITIENLSIQYRCLAPISIRQSLFQKKINRKNAYEALQRISFSIEKGEILGIVGKNGSGKSTLLRAIAGVFAPDSGSIDLHGNSVSLLSIGVGFQKALTGRSNIFLSGMLLGFSEKEINDKLEAIIEFADIGKFIDMPVKTYSSGMYSKLAFAITANLETDIMLIDEVLSVGDAKFKKKSYKKMVQLINDDNRTVLIVSHNIETLRKLCTRVLWLHDGMIKKLGNANEVLDEYVAFME